MKFRLLTIFLRVCEHMNMTRAAKSLYMTQPSVSQAIAELETQYQVRLFERLNHKLYLTAAGEKLQSYARHIINLEQQARQELSGLAGAGLLRIGASQTVGAYLLPDVIKLFHQNHPHVELFTRVENTAEIERFLLADQIDLGLVEGFVKSADIVEKVIFEDELMIVCSAQHPLTTKTQLIPANLSPFPFIVREKGSGTREIFENQMRMAGVNWKEAGLFNNTEAIKKAVQHNLGLAILPVIAITAEVEAGTIRTLQVEGLSLFRKFNLIYHRQKYFSSTIQSFIAGLDNWAGLRP